jgi:acyl-CoA-binding protein
MASNLDLELEERFKLATTHVQAVAANLDSKLLLQLYGLYKQATVGPCTAAQPSWFNVTAKQKWEAWNQLKQMTVEEAMQSYIRLVTSASPDWEDEAKDLPMGWVSVSCPVMEPEEQIEDDDKTLLDWAKEGFVHKVRQLAESGQDINQWDDMGMTALHWATDRGNVEVVECLVQLGADLNCKDSEGQTALHYAASCGHADVLKLLLKTGADPKVEDSEGDKPVDVACSPEIAGLLTV